MTFKKEEIPVFMQIFENACSKIKSFDGCTDLELVQSTDDERIHFTISRWQSAQDLEAYRNSELFHSTWAKTKILFDDKPEAWTTAPAL